MNPSNTKRMLVSILVGSPLAVISKLATEILFGLVLAVSFLLQNRLDPQELQKVAFDIGTNPFVVLVTILINLFALPFVIGCIIAKIAKTNAMVCAIAVGMVSVSVGLYYGYTADSIIKSLLKNTISFSMIIFGAFIFRELEKKENP